MITVEQSLRENLVLLDTKMDDVYYITEEMIHLYQNIQFQEGMNHLIGIKVTRYWKV